jgi:hypothetical protein
MASFSGNNELSFFEDVLERKEHVNNMDETIAL